jgi:integrase/recombinase XerD
MTRPVASLSADLISTSSLAAAIALFYGHMIRQGFSDNTLKAFQADLRLFAKYTGSNRAIGSIGQADLEEFLTWMRAGRGVPCSPKTYARRMTTLKVFFGWLAEAEILPSDPAAALVHEHPTTPLPEILYDDQVNALIRTTRDLLWAPKPDARPYLLVSLILQTGIKKSECMEIRLEHIDFSNPQAAVLYVRYADARRTHKERKLALGPSFTPVCRQYLLEYKPTEHLFEARPQSRIRPGRHGPARGYQQGSLFRADALDLRRTRLPERHAGQSAPPEDGALDDQLARDTAEDSEAGAAAAVKPTPCSRAAATDGAAPGNFG